MRNDCGKKLCWRRIVTKKISKRNVTYVCGNNTVKRAYGRDVGYFILGFLNSGIYFLVSRSIPFIVGKAKKT